MSKSTITGTGVYIDEIETTADAIRDLIRMSGSLDTDFRNYFKENEDVTYEDADAHHLRAAFAAYKDEPEWEYTVGGILATVLELNENISLNPICDCDGCWYLVLLPEYPWEEKRNAHLNDEQLYSSVLKTYLSVLTEQSFDCFYYGEHIIFHD